MNAKCETETCEARRAFRVHWPSKPVELCWPCTERAIGLAGVLGFHLHAEELNAGALAAALLSEKREDAL